MQSQWIAVPIIVSVMVSSAGSALAYRVDDKSGTITVASLADFDKCQKDYADGGSDACLEALRSYVDAQPKNAFQAGKRARLHFNHWAALSFFAKAFATAPTAEQCADSDVAAAVASGLALPTDDPNAALAQKIAGQQCWDQVRTAVLGELKGGGAYYRDNACALIAAKKVTATECQPPPKADAKPQAPSAVAALQGLDWKKLAIEPSSARALRGQNGEEVLLVRTKPSPRELVLLKFKGISGPWNQQVLVAVPRPGGRGTDYVAWVDQSEWVAVTERDGQYEAYPKGQRDGIALYSVTLNRGTKKDPTPADIAAELTPPTKPAAAAPKR
jgi:hypothetical protein